MSSRAEKYYFNMDLLSPTDIEVLRAAEKQLPPAMWPKGAAVNICHDDLNNWGFITYDSKLTDRGKWLLGEIDATLKAH